MEVTAISAVDKTLGPTTSKRSAKTTVVARDQETIVIGGLIQERTTRSVSKVPILGSLPILGWLFRNESTKKQKTNLLLFLTPYIIRNQSDVRRIFERKMAEREEFVRRFYRDDSGQRRFIDYDHKPGPLSRVRRGVEEELSKVENGGTDARGERVTDRFYKIESFGRTLYHLLGIDPDTVVTTPANRPVRLIAEDAPLIREAID